MDTFEVLADITDILPIVIIFGITRHSGAEALVTLISSTNLIIKYKYQGKQKGSGKYYFSIESKPCTVYGQFVRYVFDLIDDQNIRCLHNLFHVKNNCTSASIDYAYHENKIVFSMEK